MTTTDMTINHEIATGKAIALFVDAENLNANTDVELIYDLLEEHGLLVHCRVYAEWKTASEALKNAFSRRHADLVEVPAVNNAKNSVDNAIIADIVELLYTEPDIQVFVILSGDKDYMPALKKIKRKGKKTMMMGHGRRVARIIRESVDVFIDLERASAGTRDTPQDAGLVNQTPETPPAGQAAHKGVTIPNEERSLTLPAGTWLDVLEGMVACIKGGETTFTGVKDFIQHDVRPDFAPSLLVPVMNTLVQHGLFVQPVRGLIEVAPGFDTCHASFVAKYGLA